MIFCAIVAAANARSIEILKSGKKHLALTGVLLATSVMADESLCVIPPIEMPAHLEAPPDGRIEFRAEQGQIDRDGNVNVIGDVEIIKGDKFLRAERASYDAENESLAADGKVEFREPGVSITGEKARLNGINDIISFENSTFVMPERPSRGSAGKVTLDEDELKMSKILYTTCPEGNNDWVLKADSLDIDREESRGVARNVRIRFRDTTVLYLPYISFPTSDKRKSGLLFPAVGSTERSGTEIAVPIYWNIAPNYDATFVPHYMSKRGLQQNMEFRYLKRRGEGTLDLEYLGHDDSTGEQRSYGKWVHESVWNDRLRGLVHIEDVSDRQYFEDFGRSIDITSRINLEKNLELDYANTNWWVTIRAQDFRTIDSTITDDEKPYRRVPQFLTRGLGDTGFSNLNWSFNGELVDFDRDTGVTGQRLNLRPGLSFPMGGTGYYLRPALQIDYTAYDLDGPTPGPDPKPSRTTPIFTVDSGLVFERPVGFDAQLIQTLEPRVFYAHIPFRDQSDLPVFDTEMPTFNLVELYRANRFVGVDRLGDTDQLSVGITTRLLDEAEGRQVLSATLGQAFYLSDREVTLPGEMPPAGDESQMIAELDLDLYRKWNMDMIYQWDTDNKETALSQFRVQYLPGSTSVVNAAYRYQRDVLEESDFSFVAPLSQRWNAVGRINFSWRDNTTLERLIGFQYMSCCWNLQFVSRRYISRSSGQSDSSFMIQFELKGLSKIGSQTENVLKNGILGYPGDE